MDCIVHVVAKSWTWLSDFPFHVYVTQWNISLSLFFFKIYFPFSSSIRLVTQQLLTSDWAVYIPEEDQRDGCDKGVYLSESQVNEIEMELLKEKLQELYLQVKEQEVLPEEVKKKKKKSTVSSMWVNKAKKGPRGEE